MEPYYDFLDFYTGIADRYDLMMPWKKRRKKEEGFFKEHLEAYNVRSVLDCHCGTGFHMAMLIEMGYDVEGIDLSPDMIRVARKNLRERGLSANIYRYDVKEISRTLGRKYDCVISMGNSLPHESGDENLLSALRNMYEVLNKDGICIIHIENYDALYRDRERFIPSHYSRSNNGADVFIFVIDYFDDKVLFNILSIIERSGVPEFNVDVVAYNPIHADKLKDMLAITGFRDIRLYEDFKMTPFGKAGSYDLIITARK